MNQAQAGEIVTLLTATFHRDAMEPESQVIFAKDVALLADVDVARGAIQVLAHRQDRFPTIREFREAYHAVQSSQASRNAETRSLPEPPRRPIPTWVHVWWWCRRGRDPRESRQFPQLVDEMGVALSDEPTLTPDEYAALEREWRDAGEPKLGRAADLIAAHT